MKWSFTPCGRRPPRARPSCFSVTATPEICWVASPWSRSFRGWGWGFSCTTIEVSGEVRAHPARRGFTGTSRRPGSGFPRRAGFHPSASFPTDALWVPPWHSIWPSPGPSAESFWRFPSPRFGIWPGGFCLFSPRDLSCVSRMTICKRSAPCRDPFSLWWPRTTRWSPPGWAKPFLRGPMSPNDCWWSRGPDTMIFPGPDASTKRRSTNFSPLCRQFLLPFSPLKRCQTPAIGFGITIGGSIYHGRNNSRFLC